MTKVIDILDRQPHLEGKGFCLACKHEWQAVAMVGSFWLECPACGCNRGVFKNHIACGDGKERWSCAHCNTQVFYVQPYGAKCLGCGALSRWTEINP